MPEVIIILFIGMITGFFSGMFGIGGSVIATPLLLTFTGIDQRFAVSSPLAAVLFSSISGTISYYSQKLFEKRIIIYTLLAAIPFGILGSIINDIVNVNIIVLLKTVLLLVLSIRFFIGQKRITETSSNSLITILLLGSVGGFISGFVAIGGGIVFVSGFIFLLNKNMTQASANSLFCVGIVALVNSIIHYRNGFIDLPVSLWLAIGIIPFSFLGAKMNIRLKNRLLEIAFGSLMIIFSLYFIINNFWVNEL